MLLHHAFERTAAATPTRTALVDGARRVAYGALLRQTRALAHALRSDGVAAGDRVLVFLESSTEYAVAVHAVLMVGGVFVPVHPLAKAERLAFLAGDTRATALLTHDAIGAGVVVRHPRCSAPEDGSRGRPVRAE